MQIPRGDETIGAFDNTKVLVDWDEFFNGITAKEKIWETHTILRSSLTIISHCIFWGRFLFDLILSRDLFLLNISNNFDILFLFAICWLSLEIIGKYWRVSIAKNITILVNKYIFIHLQKTLLKAYESPRGDDVQIIFNYLINISEVIKFLRINNISFPKLYMAIENYLEEYRVKNWLAILLLDSAKDSYTNNHSHISEINVAKIFLEKMSDKK